MFNAAFAARSVLTNAFPNTHFSVRSKQSLPSNWIQTDLTILWDNGPKVEQVHQVLNTFIETRSYMRTINDCEIVIFNRKESPYLQW